MLYGQKPEESFNEFVKKCCQLAEKSSLPETESQKLLLLTPQQQIYRRKDDTFTFEETFFFKAKHTKHLAFI